MHEFLVLAMFIGKSVLEFNKQGWVLLDDHVQVARFRRARCESFSDDVVPIQFIKTKYQNLSVLNSYVVVPSLGDPRDLWLG